MQIDAYLAALAQAEPSARRAALEAALAAEGFEPEIQQHDGDAKLKPARNYLLRAEGGEPCPLVCAHYDAHTGSCGANDNAAACCILIALAKELRARGVRADFAFFDGEESGHTGAKLYLARNEREHSAIVNLDMCGYGDTIAVYTRGTDRRAGAKAFTDKQRMAAHKAQQVKFLPEGDDVCFTTRRQPVISLAIMPLWDTKFLDAMALQGSGIIGRTPEFEMMIGQMEVASTMHGEFRDAVKWVQPEAMQQVYDYVLDALCAPPPKRGLRLF